MISPRGGDFYLATSGDRNLAVDTAHGTCHAEHSDDQGHP